MKQRKIKRWSRFNERERAVLAYGLTAGMVIAATHEMSDTDEDKAKAAGTILQMTKLMDQINASFGLRGIDPELTEMLEHATKVQSRVRVHVARVEVVPEDDGLERM